MPRRILLHSTNRDPASAWPGVTGEFLALDDAWSIDTQVAALEAAARADPIIVIAHSRHAVPAVLAASNGSVAAHGVVLVEPALFDLARGDEAIEAHIGAVSEARDQAFAGNLAGYWAIVRPLMFGASFDRDRWHDERAFAERFAHVTPPWGHGVRDRMLDGIRTLVVTGNWNPEYEHIAGMLTARGATHVHLPGAGHRAQDVPEFAAALERFLG